MNLIKKGRDKTSKEDRKEGGRGDKREKKARKKEMTNGEQHAKKIKIGLERYEGGKQRC